MASLARLLGTGLDMRLLGTPLDVLDGEVDCPRRGPVEVATCLGCRSLLMTEEVPEGRRVVWAVDTGPLPRDRSFFLGPF